MFDWQRLVAETQHAQALDCVEQLNRAELLRGAAAVHVTLPEHDNAGRHWLFICGTPRGEPISIPVVITSAGIGTVVDVAALMRAYRQAVIAELEQRGFVVAVRDLASANR